MYNLDLNYKHLPHLPIALYKGTFPYHLQPIFLFLSHPTFFTLALVVMFEFLPQTYVEALQIVIWKTTMDLELYLLTDCGSSYFSLVPLIIIL